MASFQGNEEVEFCLRCGEILRHDDLEMNGICYKCEEDDYDEDDLLMHTDYFEREGNGRIRREEEDEYQ